MARASARSEVPDARLASAILGRRPAALIYHGLLALDPETLAWIEANPAVLDAFQKHPGATAVYARSIHVRNGAVVTPGDNARDIWQAIVGADPANPAAFIPKLLAARFGAVAAFYDAVAHLDAQRQRFILGSPDDPKRADRAMRVFEAINRTPPSWRLDDYPFMRPDVDAALLFRQVRLDDRGIPAGPSKERSRAGIRRRRQGLRSRRRRVAGRERAEGESGHLAAATRHAAVRAARAGVGPPRHAAGAGRRCCSDFARYPALMLTLEASGVRSAATYAAAVRVAGDLAGDDEATAVFQAGLTIVDRARAGRHSWRG